MADVYIYSRHFKTAVRDASQQWGSGWTMLSPALQRAVIAERCLAIVTLQDESVSDMAVRDMAEALYAELLEAFPDA